MQVAERLLTGISAVGRKAKFRVSVWITSGQRYQIERGTPLDACYSIFHLPLDVFCQERILSWFCPRRAREM